jgi:hypothetical protein
MGGVRLDLFQVHELLYYGVINPDASAPGTSADSKVHETGVVQRHAALRTSHDATFQPVMLAIF